jgi:hypothetical protein
MKLIRFTSCNESKKADLLKYLSVGRKRRDNPYKDRRTNCGLKL